MALASRKLLTTCLGFQPGCGGPTSSPQHCDTPPPRGGGTLAACGAPLVGSAAQPVASTAASATAAAAAMTPRPERPAAAGRQSFIVAVPRSWLPALADRVRHNVHHADYLIGHSYLGLVRGKRQRRPRQLPARRTRQGEPEDRALVRLAPCLQPPTVQPRILQGDGQAKPGPAGGPGSGRVGAPEPVEDKLLLPRAYAAAVIPDGDRHGIPVRCDGDHHIPPLTVLHRV